MTQRYKYEASGRNGTWFVDKYIDGDKRRCTYGDSVNCATKRQAEAVASALNRAFTEGMGYARYLFGPGVNPSN